MKTSKERNLFASTKNTCSLAAVFWRAIEPAAPLLEGGQNNDRSMALLRCRFPYLSPLFQSILPLNSSIMLSLIAAGISSLPFFGWSLCVVPILALLSILPLYFLLYKSPTPSSSSSSSSSKDCNVIITGGSSGIGLAIAQESCTLPQVKQITLIARNKANLAAARLSLLKLNKTITVELLSADVTDYASLQQATSQVTMQECTFLFCCAGISHPGYFQEIAPETFEQQVKLNYLGSVYTVKTLLPKMKSGCITLTSSGAGQIGVFGFTAYSPTKFALQGFAQALFMELSNTPINIQVAFPNDTNTPGYQEELYLKPKECHLISESGGLSLPSDIAKKMVKQAMRPNPPFSVYFGLEGWMLTTLTAGMSPVSSLLEAVTQVALMGIFRFISLFYLHDFWNIVRNCANEKETTNEGSSAVVVEDKKDQ